MIVQLIQYYYYIYIYQLPRNLIYIDYIINIILILSPLSYVRTCPQKKVFFFCKCVVRASPQNDTARTLQADQRNAQDRQRRQTQATIHMSQDQLVNNILTQDTYIRARVLTPLEQFNNEIIGNLRRETAMGEQARETAVGVRDRARTRLRSTNIARLGPLDTIDDTNPIYKCIRLCILNLQK